jgi:hypothetical protein
MNAVLVENGAALLAPVEAFILIAERTALLFGGTPL